MLNNKISFKSRIVKMLLCIFILVLNFGCAVNDSSKIFISSTELDAVHQCLFAIKNSKFVVDLEINHEASNRLKAKISGAFGGKITDSLVTIAKGGGRLTALVHSKGSKMDVLMYQKPQYLFSKNIIIEIKNSSLEKSDVLVDGKYLFRINGNNESVILRGIMIVN